MKARDPPRRVHEQTGTAAPVVGAIDRGSGGGSGAPRRRLGRQPQRREEPPHRMGVGHRAEDPPPAPAAIAHQHIKAEHARSRSGSGSCRRSAATSGKKNLS